MRIGSDVAALALNRQVDLIVVASNDTELIPAFKLSRWHGVQVAVAKVGSFTPHIQIVEKQPEWVRLRMLMSADWKQTEYQYSQPDAFAQLSPPSVSASAHFGADEYWFIQNLTQIVTVETMQPP